MRSVNIGMKPWYERDLELEPFLTNNEESSPATFLSLLAKQG